VKSLSKGDYERCVHLRRGPIKGCGIYKDRPEACSGYECLWRAGIIEAADFRPDKCGFVLSGTISPEIGPYIMVHELRPGASRTERANKVLRAIAEHSLVIEITREGIRKVRGGPIDAVQRMLAIAQEKQAQGVPDYSLTKNEPGKEP
jgi:hypothetical protein